MTISHAIIYAGGIGVPQTQNLRNQLAYLNQPQQPQAGHLPTTGLLILFTSWGGNTYEARALYGLLRSLPYPVEIHAVGVIQSCAIQIMLAADRRTAAPDTKFLFHEWTWGSDAHPGRGLDAIRQAPIQLEDEHQWARQILKDRSKLTDSDIDSLQLLRAPRIESAKFALEHGLIEEVAERKIPPTIMTWNITG